MKCRFDLVVVIGCGKIAEDVLSYVNKERLAYGYRLQFVEHEHRELSRLKTLCGQTNIPYEQIAENANLTRWLAALTCPTLIISAGNYYIFPKTIVEKRNLEIINFHNALLPKLPGRNAPTWAIYLGESVTGPTWHYVTAGIDAGAVIAQGQIPISEDVKAYELTRAIMERAFELFRAFYRDLLAEHIAGTPQSGGEAPRKIYYSYELPSDGRCSLDMPPDELYRLLRAVDYGKSGIFPPMKLTLPGGKEVRIQRYGKQQRAVCGLDEVFSLDPERRAVYLRIDDRYELKIKYQL